MTHSHCDRCFLADCRDTSSCPLVPCPNGCFARMHECKRADHDNVCPNLFIPCLNANYGCPLTVRRSELAQHLNSCPASITVCPFVYDHEYQFDSLDDSAEPDFVQSIARRDSIWYEHESEFYKQQELLSESNSRRYRPKPAEQLIRSEKYSYITIPKCMLSEGDGVICSACKIRLRQLEEEEDQRLSELPDEERNLMADRLSHADTSSSPSSSPSLVKTSTTLIDPANIPITPDLPPPSDSSLTQIEPMPVISDTELPSSYIYRLNYFSSNQHPQAIPPLRKSLRFGCLAICRRDELEQHCLIHLHIDCTLNRFFTERCPKSQYGCKFQYENLQPCQKDGQPIRFRFDQRNDAIAFELCPNIAEASNGNTSLLDFPSEILEKILLQLDSLSLRNISLVCRRLRGICRDLLPSRGIVVSEYERRPLSHGGVKWIERKKHWLFSNTTSAVPQWRLNRPNKLTSIAQHLVTCPFGETKDLQKEPPFPLLVYSRSKDGLEPTE